LDGARAVAEVEEDHLALVPAYVDPPVQADGLPYHLSQLPDERALELHFLFLHIGLK